MNRIVIVSHGYYPEFGGMERFVHRLGKQFANNNIDITVMTTNRIVNKENVKLNVSRKRIEYIDGIKVCALGWFPYLWRIKGMRWLACMLFHVHLVFWIIWINKFIDYYVVAAIQREFAILNLLSRLLKKCKIMGIEGSSGQSLDYYILKNFLFNKIYYLMIRLGRGRIVAFGSSIYNQYNQLNFPEHRLMIIPNGIEPISRHSIYSPASKLVVCIGRFHPIKGQRYAIEACKKIEDHNIPFLFHGSGVERRDLESLVTKLEIKKDLVQFSFSSRDVPIKSIMEKAALLVIPSLSEGMSTVQIEAMSMGIPMIVTDVGSNAEVLNISNHAAIGEYIKNEYGFIVNPQDVIGLSKAILAAFSDPECLLQMSNLLKDRFKRFYDISKIAEGYLVEMRK